MRLSSTSILTAMFVAGLSTAALATELHLSHQWSTKDVRHQVAQIVADEVAAANVELDIKIFHQNHYLSPVSNIGRSAEVSWI